MPFFYPSSPNLVVAIVVVVVPVIENRTSGLTCGTPIVSMGLLTQDSADLAMASPSLVLAPPWAEIPGPLARDYPDLWPGLVVRTFGAVYFIPNIFEF